MKSSTEMKDDSTTMSLSSPSAERRKALKDADSDNQLKVLPSYPLSKYLDLTERMCYRFNDAVHERRLDEAYVFGLRFANLGLVSLPQHPAWKASTNIKAKKRLASQVENVLEMMESIKKRMDAEELMKIKGEMIARKERDSRMKEEEERLNQQLDEERRREQQKRRNLEIEREEFYAQQRSQRMKEIDRKKKKDNASKQKKIEQSAMSKFCAMQDEMASANDVDNKGVIDAFTEAKSVKSQSFETKGKKEKKKIKKWFIAEKKIVSPKKEKDSSATLTSNAASRSDNENEPNQKTILREENTEKRSINTSNVHKKETKTDQSSDLTSTPSTSNDVVDSLAKGYDDSPIIEHQSLSTKSVENNVAEQSLQNENEHVPNAPDMSTVDSTPSKASSPTSYIIAAQHTPISKKEKATIHNLQRAISLQENRLEEIEEKQIPSLLRAAKAFLTEKNKNGALRCLAHKKRLEPQVDVIKAAVFNMETQMFMLESAFEDRQVQKALDEAQAAISGYQRGIGDPKVIMVDLTNMSTSLPELETGDETDEELISELEQWLSPEEKEKSRQKLNNNIAKDDNDDVSMLSMPTFLPTVPLHNQADNVLDKSSSLTSVEGVIKAVLGM